MKTVTPPKKESKGFVLVIKPIVVRNPFARRGSRIDDKRRKARTTENRDWRKD